MRKLLLITFLILFFVTGIEAQLQNKSNAKDIISSVLEIGSNGLHRPGIPGQSLITFSGIGPAYLLGDLGVLKNPLQFDISLFETSALYSVGLQHIFPNNVGIKAAAYYGTFSGTDEGIGSKYPQRGYSFQSKLYEFTVQGEYFFYGGPYSKSNNRNSWYIFAGVGIINSHAVLSLINSQGKDSTITRPPLGRPGDKIILNPNPALVIPSGLGYQYRLNDKLTFGAEFGYHLIFSDYIDGIHTKEGINNDVLAALTFTFTYKFAESGPSSSMKNRCNCVWQ